MDRILKTCFIVILFMTTSNLMATNVILTRDSVSLYIDNTETIGIAVEGGEIDRIEVVGQENIVSVTASKINETIGELVINGLSAGEVELTINVYLKGQSTPITKTIRVVVSEPEYLPLRLFIQRLFLNNRNL